MASERLVFLHGFTQTGASWDGVRAALGPSPYTADAPDLRGHGANHAADPITFSAAVDDVVALLAGHDDVHLVGYSLGGRIALHAALAAPSKVTRLMLISTTAGIADEAERAGRRKTDERWATRLLTEPADTVIDAWGNQPLFAGQSAAVRATADADRRRNRPEAMAAVLRGMGTGVMPAVWDRLPELRMPVDIVVGQRDAKFVEIGARLAAACRTASLHTIDGVGHAVPLEAPGAVAALLRP